MVCIKKQPYIYFVRLTFKNRHFFIYLTCLLDRGHITMRVRIEGYTVITKKLQTSYNIGVQANCKTKGVKTMAQKAHSLSHTKWMCKYHIVFTPKYRRKIIYNQYRSSLGEIFHRLCQYKGVEIIEGHLMQIMFIC